jgi:NADH dehydrogenase
MSGRTDTDTAARVATGDGALVAAPRRPVLVVVGCGFGGLWCVRAAASLPIDIVLVDRTNHHLFQPLLYQVATAGLSAPAISAPIRHILRRQVQGGRLTVLQAEVASIDAPARAVVLDDGDRLAYDHLVVAAGATHSYFGRNEWARHAPGLKTLADALAIRANVIGAFERAERTVDAAERGACMTFVVVGGGPTGVEMAGTMAEIARLTLAHEFRRIDPAASRVLLVEAGPRLLAAFVEAQSEQARASLQSLGVDVRLGARVTSIDAGGLELTTAGGTERIEARTVVWAAGVAGSPLGASLAATAGATLDRAGRVVVAPDLSIAGHPEISVIGDLAAAGSTAKDGTVTPVPGVSPAAKQMGRHAARNLARRLRGQPTTAFRYIDYGNLATIGRKSAVVDLHVPGIGPVRFAGLAAWLFWLFAHIWFLIGFRSRLIVFVDWMWAYVTYERSARVVAVPEGGDRI